MGIKKLKKENEILNLTLADMLSSFDTSKTKKYSQFISYQINISTFNQLIFKCQP